MSLPLSKESIRLLNESADQPTREQLAEALRHIEGWCAIDYRTNGGSRARLDYVQALLAKLDGAK